MPYVTGQAAYHAWYGLKPGKPARTLQAISRPTLPTIVCHASRTTRMRPPFDLVAVRSPSSLQARILEDPIQHVHMYRLGLDPAKQGWGSRRQPGNSPQVPFSHIAYSEVEGRDWPPSSRPKSIS